MPTFEERSFSMNGSETHQNPHRGPRAPQVQSITITHYRPQFTRSTLQCGSLQRSNYHQAVSEVRSSKASDRSLAPLRKHPCFRRFRNDPTSGVVPGAHSVDWPAYRAKFPAYLNLSAGRPRHNESPLDPRLSKSMYGGKVLTPAALLVSRSCSHGDHVSGVIEWLSPGVSLADEKATSRREGVRAGAIP